MSQSYDFKQGRKYRIEVYPPGADETITLRGRVVSRHEGENPSVRMRLDSHITDFPREGDSDIVIMLSELIRIL
jgi:hypothetical protein